MWHTCYHVYRYHMSIICQYVWHEDMTIHTIRNVQKDGQGSCTSPLTKFATFFRAPSKASVERMDKVCMPRWTLPGRDQKCVSIDIPIKPFLIMSDKPETEANLQFGFHYGDSHCRPWTWIKPITVLDGTDVHSLLQQKIRQVVVSIKVHVLLIFRCHLT